MLVLYVHPFL